MVRNQFFQAMSLDVAHNFIEFLDLRQRSLQYKEDFNVHPSKKAYEDAVHYAGFGPAVPKTEGSPVGYDVLIQGGTRRYVHQTYGLGGRASYELMADDQTGMMEQMPKGLVPSHIFAMEQTGANVFNFGFSSTGTITDDGVSLFNNQHPLSGGPQATNIAPGASLYSTASGTYPNRPQTYSDLSTTSLLYATLTFQRMPNARGLSVAVRPSNLLIAPETEPLAIELLGSAGKPNTGDNTVNWMVSLGLKYSVRNYFTAPNYWYMTSEKQDHRLMFYEREPVYFDRDRDFDSQALKVIAIARYSAGADTWLNTFGSAGP